MEFSKREFQFIAKGLEALASGIAIGIAVYVTVEILPVCLKNYEFERALRNEAHAGTTHWQSAAAITDDVMEKARDLGLPVDRSEIKVSSTQKPVPVPVEGVEAMVASGGNDLPMMGDVSVDASFAVPIRFPGHTFHWNFHFHADDRSL
jgi:hypothetical protein